MSILKLANPEATKDNLLVLHESKTGCCNSESKICKYVIDEDITNVTSITIRISEDETKELTFEAAANTPKEVRLAIAKALKAEGYDPYYCDSWKGIVAESDQLFLIGDVVPVSAMIDGTSHNFEARCEMMGICKYKGVLSFETSGNPFMVNGTLVSDFAANATGFTSAQEAQFKTFLETSLNTAGITFNKVEVMTDPVNGEFVYTIHLVGDGNVVSMAGSSAVNCGCYPDFI